MKRCQWVPENDALYQQYHDKEWGVPVHDDRLLFEFLILETFQAGLSWKTILYKRENFRLAFDNFDFVKVADYNQAKIDNLLQDKGIIRNKLKINSAVNNARAFIQVIEAFGTFDNYIWGFVNHKTIVNQWKDHTEIPATSTISDKLSADLKARGFKFVGSTVVYAHMQATGMVNDHITACFRYTEV